MSGQTFESIDQQMTYVSTNSVRDPATRYTVKTKEIVASIYESSKKMKHQGHNLLDCTC